MYNVYNMYIIDYSYFVWKGIKTSYRPKNSTAPEPRPPVLKFLDPPLSMFNYMYCLLYYDASQSWSWAKRMLVDSFEF